jgi:transposase
MVPPPAQRPWCSPVGHERDCAWAVSFIGIDEIAVAKGRRYLTVVMDLETRAVGDGKGVDALDPFRKRLRPGGARIEAVAMNMAAA